MGFLVGHGQGEGLGQLPHHRDAPVLAVLLKQNVLLGRRDQCHPLRGRARGPLGPVEAAEQGAADFVLLQHHRHRLFLVDGGAAGAAALGVGYQRLPQVLGQPQVVHHQPAGLILEHPVDPGDGLHQPVAPHRLVQVHGVQAGRVEAGQPHVPHQARSRKGIVGVAEPVGQRLPSWLVPDVLLPVGRIGGGAGHHHLDAAPGVIMRRASQGGGGPALCGGRRRCGGSCRPPWPCLPGPPAAARSGQRCPGRSA